MTPGIAVSETPPTPAPVAPPPPPPAALVEQELTAHHALFAALRAHDARALAARYAPDATLSIGPVDVHGGDAIAALAESVWTAFPDEKLQWGHVLQAGDVLAVELGWTGTSTERFHDHAPAHKAVGASALLVERFNDNALIVSQRLYVDVDNVANALAWGSGKAHPFEGLPTAQVTVPDHTAPSPVDDEPLRTLAATLQSGAYKNVPPFDADALWIDFSKGHTSSGKGLNASWTASLYRAYLGAGHVTPWSAGDYVVLEWKGSAGKGSAGAAISADVLKLEGGKVVEVWTYR